MKYQYRILDASEWDKLTTIVEPSHLPHPDTASAAVAIDDDGNIQGVLFLQLALHMEPIVLKSPSVSFVRLHKTLYDAVKTNTGLHVYCFSDKEIVSAMARHVGMDELPYKVFTQEVK